MLKSYRVVTSSVYRLLILLAYPLAAISCCAFLQLKGMNGEPSYYMLPAGLMCSAVMAVEIIADYFVFSGANSQKGDKLDILKTSTRGILLYRNALIADQIRRVIYIVGLQAINLLIYQVKMGFPGINLQEMILLALYVGLDLFFINLAIFICRFTQNVITNYAISQVLSFFTMIPLMAIGSSENAMRVAAAIFCVLAIGMMMVGTWYSLKVRKESYFDE